MLPQQTGNLVLPGFVWCWKVFRFVFEKFRNLFKIETFVMVWYGLVEIVKFGRKHTRNMANIPEIYSGQHTHPDNLSGADPSSPDKMSS